MIKKLRGILDFVAKDYLIINVNDIFYQIFCSSRCLNSIQNIGEIYTLNTELIVREDSMTLYGFINDQEQNIFKLITNVQGVGMKVGLAILSVANPDEICDAIQTKQPTFFTTADGVGPKLANRIVNELKDKIAKNISFKILNTNIKTATSIVQETLSALVNLGYKPMQANQAINYLQQNNEQFNTLEEILKKALHYLNTKN